MMSAFAFIVLCIIFCSDLLLANTATQTPTTSPINVNCGLTEWCLGIKTHPWEHSDTASTSIYLRLLLESHNNYYWSEWYNLDNPNCNDFRRSGLDYFNVTCYNDWYGMAIKNDNGDAWAMDKIVYNGVTVDSFKTMDDNWRDFFWIQNDNVHEFSQRYVYFDKSGAMISYNETYVPIYPVKINCGLPEWCLETTTFAFEPAKSDSLVISFRVLLESNNSYYWSEWYNLNNANCSDFRSNDALIDYFNIPCYNEWYGIAIKNDNDDGWAFDKIVYNGVIIDSFRDIIGRWIDTFWVQSDDDNLVSQRYVYFDKNGTMISYNESFLPVYPSTSQTISPTSMPTIEPTLSPTFVTLDPTTYPSTIPTSLNNTPIIVTSVSPSNTPGILQYNAEHVFFILSIIIAVVAATVAIIGIIYAKCITYNELFRVTMVSIPFFYFYDQISDIFVAIKIYAEYRAGDGYTALLLGLFIMSIVFIIIPCIISTWQLICEVDREFITDNNVGASMRSWLIKYSKLMYLFTLLFGSSHASISMLNSYWLGFGMFDMGIPSYSYINWQNKRLYGMVLFEDIPQIIIQIIYIFITTDSLSIITYVSIVWTGLSILSSIFSFITNKSISDNNEFVIISMDIINDNDIKYKLARAKFTHIKRKLGTILRISSESITVLKPLVITDGVCIKFILNTKSYKETDNEKIRKNDLSDVNGEMKKFKDLIIDSKNIEILIKQFNKSWNLNLSTKINNIDIKYMECIKRSKDTVKIELINNDTNSNIPNDGNNIDLEMMNIIDDPNIEGNPEGNTETAGYVDVSDSDI